MKASSYVMILLSCQECVHVAVHALTNVKVQTCTVRIAHMQARRNQHNVAYTRHGHACAFTVNLESAKYQVDQENGKLLGHTNGSEEREMVHG